MNIHSQFFGFIFVILFADLGSCSQPNQQPPAATQTPASALANPTICAEIGKSRVSPIDGMTQICVPAGEFWMGADESDPQAAPDEKPRHLVFLDAFWIDRTEVTNDMFENCVSAGACHERTYSPYLWGVRLPNGTPYYGEDAYRDAPVIMLDSNEAQAYCRWVERRLPSEAEWEKAARGTDERLYPWGADLDCEHASYLGCGKEPNKNTSYPLGVSPYGVLNLSGNLWEWVGDWYDPNYYQHSPTQTRLAQPWVSSAPFAAVAGIATRLNSVPPTAPPANRSILRMARLVFDVP